MINIWYLKSAGRESRLLISSCWETFRLTGLARILTYTEKSVIGASTTTPPIDIYEGPSQWLDLSEKKLLKIQDAYHISLTFFVHGFQLFNFSQQKRFLVHPPADWILK